MLLFTNMSVMLNPILLQTSLEMALLVYFLDEANVVNHTTKCHWWAAVKGFAFIAYNSPSCLILGRNMLVFYWVHQWPHKKAPLYAYSFPYHVSTTFSAFYSWNSKVDNRDWMLHQNLILLLSSLALDFLFCFFYIVFILFFNNYMLSFIQISLFIVSVHSNRSMI